MNSEIISGNEKLKQIKLKVELKDVKSDYFLIKLFDLIKANISLNVIKYNKNLQKRANISIKNYKDYSQLYSSVEIELKLIDNKCGKFINIFDKEKEHYHIYFDNSNEEIKRNYLKEEEKVNKIRIIIDHQIKSFKGLFYYCKCIKEIFFKKFCRTNITDMSSMFFGCSSIKELELSNFNTNNVTDMSQMFRECSSINELNLSKFNTNKVTDMNCMFQGCKSLNKLNISKFNTNKVIDMSNMFYECSSLDKINISKFNTNKETVTKNMFYGCSNKLKQKIKQQNKNLII